jgi:myo-inositol catabolism protein IolS
MEYRPLGTTNITISAMVLGCWALAEDSNWGVQDEADSRATIRTALDAGINCFDTAELYGNGQSEVVLGRALAGMRREVVIASKVSDKHMAPADLIAACEGSLRRLGTDYLDLYQLHWANPAVPIADTLGALARLQEQGKVRAVGVCNFGARDLAGLLRVGKCAANQLPYSLLWRAIEDEVLPFCAVRLIGVLAYSPLSQGLLTGKFTNADEVPEGRARTRHFSHQRPCTRHGEPGCEAETFEAVERVRELCQAVGQPMADVALAWVRQQPGVESVIVGARTPEQVRDNVRALGVRLAPDVVAALDGATAPLKQALGPSVDMWQAESRVR